MADFGGYLILDEKKIENDRLYLYGEPKSLALLMTLIDKELLVKPKITSNKAYLAYLKNPTLKNIEIKIGTDKTPKDAILSVLQFVGIIK